MKNLSLDNGVNFINLNQLTEDEKKKIITYWGSIFNVMDRDTMEKVNNCTDADTNTVVGKIQYISDYLQVCKYDIIIG